MKHYTIKFDNNNNNRSNGSIFSNASKNLDNIILSNLKKMNPFMTNIDSTDPTLDAMFDETFGKDYIIIPNRNYDYLLKGDFDTEFAKAAKFLANYNPKKIRYTLIDGTPIEFFEDEIQIGFDLIPLYKLSSPRYYSTLAPKTKNTIINIFISINR